MTSKKDEAARVSHGPSGLQARFQEIWRGCAALKYNSSVQSGAEIAPGVRLWFDPEGKQKVACRAERGGGLTIKADVTQPGRWLGLHFDLGDCDFSEREMLGLFARSYAARALSWRVCLRSHRPGGFVDHFFEKYGVSYAASSTHIDALEFDPLNGFPARMSKRELILFFHVESFDLTLQDMRLFCA